MKVGKYYRANVNSRHDRVKAKVLTLLRYRDTWLTVYELWQGCRFKSDGTLRSHCGVWASGTLIRNHIHDGILVRRARGRAGQYRPIWEYHISAAVLKWLQWNVDKAGLLDIILGELELNLKQIRLPIN